MLYYSIDYFFVFCFFENIQVRSMSIASSSLNCFSKDPSTCKKQNWLFNLITVHNYVTSFNNCFLKNKRIYINIPTNLIVFLHLRWIPCFPPKHQEKWREAGCELPFGAQTKHDSVQVSIPCVGFFSWELLQSSRQLKKV